MILQKFISTYNLDKKDLNKSILAKIAEYKNISFLEMYKVEIALSKNPKVFDSIIHQSNFIHYLSRKNGVKVSNLTISSDVEDSIREFYLNPPDWYSFYMVDYGNLSKFHINLESKVYATRDKNNNYVITNPNNDKHFVKIMKHQDMFQGNISNSDDMYDFMYKVSRCWDSNDQDELHYQFKFKQCNLNVVLPSKVDIYEKPDHFLISINLNNFEYFPHKLPYSLTSYLGKELKKIKG